MSISCPVCSKDSRAFRVIDGVKYLECRSCDFIFADPKLLQEVDDGNAPRRYDNDYWVNEIAAARERSFGSSLARSAEALLYCQIPVNKFVDIGTGPGYLLDALSTYLPSHRSRFYGVEKFPPRIEERSKHENYLCADLRDVDIKFECGVCIEVIEHLTPKMAENLASAVASVSVPGSLFLFNTGLTDYVRHENPDYLDPYGRGHITCWSVKSVEMIFGKYGFTVNPLRGKAWAFVIERLPAAANVALADRIWSAPPQNAALLSDPAMGDVMYILGRESARAYT